VGEAGEVSREGEGIFRKKSRRADDALDALAVDAENKKRGGPLDQLGGERNLDWKM